LLERCFGNGFLGASLATAAAVGFDCEAIFVVLTMAALGVVWLKLSFGFSAGMRSQ